MWLRKHAAWIVLAPERAQPGRALLPKRLHQPVFLISALCFLLSALLARAQIDGVGRRPPS